MSVKKWFLVCASVSVLGTASARSATVTVGPDQNLQNAIRAASPGDTILVHPGVYTATTTPENPFNAIFDITKSLTIRSIGGPAVTTLEVVPEPTGKQFTAIRIFASNFVLDGFTIRGGNWGVQVVDWQAGSALSNVVLRNLVIETNALAAVPGHGIWLSRTSNSVIENCRVKNAYATGILLDNNSNYNLVINSAVERTDVQHGIGVKNSHFNVIAGNTITGAGFDGILLIGASYNRVEGNAVSGFKNDGIALTKEEGSGAVSRGNYVGRNLVVSDGWAMGRTVGAGIWLNSESDGNLVFANNVSGSAETGIPVFNSSRNIIRANAVHRNGQGGVFLYTDPGSSGPSPAYNVIEHNYLFNHLFNAGIYSRAAGRSHILFNFITSGPDSDANAAGIILQTTAHTNVYGNTIRNLKASEYVYADVTTSGLFLNRHFNSPDQYSMAPAQVAWDAGPTLGGNYWSNWAAAGNPSTTTPYTNFIYNAAGARGGGYADRYPYQSENFGRPYAIEIVQPSPGLIAAAGSRKTIAWKSQGCVLVDILLARSGGSATTIASNYPDSGYYLWNVPALTPGSDYTIELRCKTSSGADTGARSTSGQFSITGGDLILLSPGPYAMANAGGTLLVSWRKSSSVGAVDVFLKTDAGGGYALAQASVTDNFVRITLPFAASNRASVMIRDPANANASDSLDGFFTIRSTAGAFTSPSASGTLVIGSEVWVEWVSPQGSEYVDLELWNPAVGQFQSLISNLADFGRFSWLVPDAPTTNLYIRAIFKNANNQIVGVTQSANFNIVPPVPASNQPPVALSVSPSAGSGAAQSFTVVATDPNGASDIAALYFLINAPPLNGARACFVEYKPALNQFRLMVDAGNAWLGPINAGSAGSLSNSQCTLEGATSTGSASGTTVTATIAVAFKSAFSGLKNLYLNVDDQGGLSSGYQVLGSWTVP